MPKWVFSPFCALCSLNFFWLLGKQWINKGGFERSVFQIAYLERQKSMILKSMSTKTSFFVSSKDNPRVRVEIWLCMLKTADKQLKCKTNKNLWFELLFARRENIFVIEHVFGPGPSVDNRGWKLPLSRCCWFWAISWRHSDPLPPNQAVCVETADCFNCHSS